MTFVSFGAWQTQTSAFQFETLCTLISVIARIAYMEMGITQPVHRHPGQDNQHDRSDHDENNSDRQPGQPW
jgi:hypothetical protein